MAVATGTGGADGRGVADGREVGEVEAVRDEVGDKGEGDRGVGVTAGVGLLPPGLEVGGAQAASKQRNKAIR